MSRKAFKKLVKQLAKLNGTIVMVLALAVPSSLPGDELKGRLRCQVEVMI
jgi:hypothetical protein